LRVLIATDYYAPSIGGGQIQSQLLARNLRDRGHEVVVATAWQNSLPAEEDDSGIAVYRLRQLRTLRWLARSRPLHHQPPFPDPVTIVGLRRLIRRFDPDLVHAYGWVSYSCAAALTGKATPLLITARDYGYSCANRTLMRDGVECDGPALTKCVRCAGRNYGRPKGWAAALGVLASGPLLRRRAQAIHCISAYVREIVLRDFVRHGSPVEIQVIHDIVDDARQDSDNEATPWTDSARLEELPDEPFLLFVGALRRIKGVEQLLAAYAMLHDPPPLVLIGTIEQDSPVDFPPGALLIKDLPHEAVMAAYDRCLFGVMPSLFPEPFGTVVAEAMSRGKPVIGTRPGGHTDMIVDDETGLLVPSGDVAALAEAMQLLISDPATRERLGKAARVRAKRFTAGASLRQIERLYRDLVEGVVPVDVETK
jgi:glycosyltransferase involved in cell wall biosynthesis